MSWIDEFMEYTDGIPSPEIFRLWSGIAAVAGALERRVHCVIGNGYMYANLFILLVSPPGVGKSQAISQTQDVWRELSAADNKANKLHVAPNSLTKAALVDALQAAARRIMIPNTMEFLEFNSLQIASSEFGVLLPTHDIEFLSVLNDIYDNPKSYQERRRHMAKQINIKYPQINILAGTQPGFLQATLPEAAWDMGFTSRIIMVYSGTPIHIPLFGNEDQIVKPRKPLIRSMQRIFAMNGRFQWTRGAQQLLENWNNTGRQPVPEHAKLLHYLPRRILYITKLAMVASAARHSTMIIEEADIQQAMDWLFTAESFMPDIFHEMVGRSDAKIMAALHFFMMQKFASTNTPIPKAAMVLFLSNQVQSHRMDTIITGCEEAGIIERLAGTDTYIPKSRSSWGQGS